jgi:hypothetical protein
VNFAGGFERESRCYEVGARCCLRCDSGSVAAHVDLDEDLRGDGGISVDSKDGRKLVRVIDHEREAIWSKGFGYKGEALYCCWSDGEAVEELEPIRIGQDWGKKGSR